MRLLPNTANGNGEASANCLVPVVLNENSAPIYVLLVAVDVHIDFVRILHILVFQIVYGKFETGPRPLGMAPLIANGYKTDSRQEPREGSYLGLRLPQEA